MTEEEEQQPSARQALRYGGSDRRSIHQAIALGPSRAPCNPARYLRGQMLHFPKPDDQGSPFS